MSVDLDKFNTEDFFIAVEDSAVKDYQGNVYHIVNKHTKVTEHETPFFSEAVGYLLAIQDKFNTSIEAFDEEKGSEVLGMPKIH